MTQVIVPAHNEAAVIERCLDSLLRPPRPDHLDVLVVCNGCRDDTAPRARAFGEPVRVIETPVPSKAHALDLGDDHATGFPRIYVDADVELTPGSLLALAEALDRPGVAAAGPHRILDTHGATRPARSYFEIWRRQASVRRGLSGRGSYGFSAEGRARFGRFAGVLADDLFVHSLFDAGSFTLVDGASVVVRPPRTLRAVVRRRARTLNLRHELAESRPELRTALPGSATAWVAAVRDEPRLAVHAPVFVGASLAARVVARHQARRGRRSGWTRDDTSRTLDGERS
jgi:glycosyltransferase involved in cell wall biosynthesis